MKTVTQVLIWRYILHKDLSSLHVKFDMYAHDMSPDKGLFCLFNLVSFWHDQNDSVWLSCSLFELIYVCVLFCRGLWFAAGEKSVKACPTRRIRRWMPSRALRRRRFPRRSTSRTRWNECSTSCKWHLLQQYCLPTRMKLSVLWMTLDSLLLHPLCCLDEKLQVPGGTLSQSSLKIKKLTHHWCFFPPCMWPFAQSGGCYTFLPLPLSCFFALCPTQTLLR